MLFLWAPAYHDRQVNLKSPSFFYRFRRFLRTSIHTQSVLEEFLGDNNGEIIRYLLFLITGELVKICCVTRFYI